VRPQDDDLPFVLNVETAFRITGRGTVIMGVIEHGVLHTGDHLELIQPSGTGAAPPQRFQCLGVDPAPRVTGRDPALGYPIAIFVAPGIEPDTIRPGARLRAAAEKAVE
jgi:translation elongation factor EF-Tu-like GTPase